MPQFSRKVSIDWKGSLMEGKGAAKAGTGAFTLPVTFPKRIGEPEGARARRMLLAAHAACFAMVIAGAMGKKSATVAKHTVTCTVIADKSDAGIKIMTFNLDLTAEGFRDGRGQFVAMAKEAEKGCPVSNALRNRSRSRLGQRHVDSPEVGFRRLVCLPDSDFIDRWCAWLRGPRAGRSTQRRIEVALDPDGHL